METSQEIVSYILNNIIEVLCVNKNTPEMSENTVVDDFKNIEITTITNSDNTVALNDNDNTVALNDTEILETPDNGNISYQEGFSLKLESINYNTSSGFGELSLNNSSCFKWPLSQYCENNKLSPDDSDFERLDEKNVDFEKSKNEHQILTSTPKKTFENCCELYMDCHGSFCSDKVSKIDLSPSNQESEDIIDKLIDEAIDKYDVDSYKEFKEVSVQTFPVECQCFNTSDKIHSPPLKKYKPNKNFSFASYKTIDIEPRPLDSDENYNQSKNFIETQDHSDLLNEDINTPTESHLSDFTPIKRSYKVRIGLSKRAQPRPLHTKLTF